MGAESRTVTGTGIENGAVVGINCETGIAIWSLAGIQIRSRIESGKAKSGAQQTRGRLDTSADDGALACLAVEATPH
ncbi:hypothetical protein EVAR_87017_1 [Eumeta japonica]|uniref:Uncharacterized protein n=1 Tax=Eumeta variegata TaxID=151549 RepID=A0A4C1W6X2_EUMVA|nr:hypothetical protein EVAR_87017_1 [Eumeta japonica]